MAQVLSQTQAISLIVGQLRRLGYVGNLQEWIGWSLHQDELRGWGYCIPDGINVRHIHKGSL